MAETTAANGDKIIGRIRFDATIEESAVIPPLPDQPEIIEITIVPMKEDR